MKNKDIAKVGVFSAVYVAITLVLAPLSYGPIQVRLSDSLYQLVRHNKVYVIALTLGTAITNFFSPLGVIDIVMGTSATFIGSFVSWLLCQKLEKKWHKELATATSCALAGIIIAIELNMVYGIPILINWLYVGIGEFVACLVGIPLVRALEKRIQL